jgi:hypothetical protein
MSKKCYAAMKKVLYLQGDVISFSIISQNGHANNDIPIKKRMALENARPRDTIKS